MIRILVKKLIFNADIFEFRLNSSSTAEFNSMRKNFRDVNFLYIQDIYI